MSFGNEQTSTFNKALQNLEEVHLREIARLTQDHEQELSILRKEYDSQLFSTPGQSTSEQVVSNFQPLASRMAPSSMPIQDAGIISSHGSSLNTASDASQYGVSEEDETIRTKIQEDRKIWRVHVARQLEQVKQNKMSMLDKYAMARGWETKVPTSRGFARKTVAHHYFDGICAVAITLNTGLLGAITSFNAASLGADRLPLHYAIANQAFSAWFLIELLLRWIAEGPCRFITTSPNMAWNIFDIILVGADSVDYILDWTRTGRNNTLDNLIVMRMLRVARIARALRVVRLLNLCKALRIMVLSIMRSGMTLLWSMVMLGIIIYVFGMFIMTSVTDHLAKRLRDLEQHEQLKTFAQESNEGKLSKYFGTFSMTSYYLFQTVSGGISWGEVADPLTEASWTYGLVFCFFVFFTIFAMLNIITGIFVETSLNSAKNDTDEVIREEMNTENSKIKQLQQIFTDVDENHSGSITERQFESLLEDKHTHALMGALGLQMSEARGVFSMLDTEGCGAVSIEEFLVGCMRLQGGAREVDLVSLMYESQRLKSRWDQLAKYLESEFQRMDKFEDRVDECLRGIVELRNCHVPHHVQSVAL